MSSQMADPVSKETPMERIFFKVVGRKMTSREKEILHLNGKNGHSLRGGSRSAVAQARQFRN